MIIFTHEQCIIRYYLNNSNKHFFNLKAHYLSTMPSIIDYNQSVKKAFFYNLHNKLIIEP